MFSRITYAFRETWASFQRNLTLTAAAILTAAVALLLVGVTLLIQEGFSNLLAKWTGGVEMIVYVKPEYSTDQARIDALEQQLQSNAGVKKVTRLNQAESYEQAKRVLTWQTSLLETLTIEKMPAQLRVVPEEGTAELLPLLKEQFDPKNNPTVWDVGLATDDIKVVAKISNFVRRFTIGASVVLLIVAVVLIWNTIRTAMFARRREIEVMKLVGATNWFIRVPFMLEGLLQGLIGSLLSCGGLALVNGLWNNSLGSFGSKDLLTNDLVALQVSGPYLRGVMIIILIVGALVGAVAAGIAASRFLDV
jgi:cell division transport system permease protein